MDWYSAAFGLIGTVVGALISGWATHAAQAKALTDAKTSRLEAKEDAAIAALAEEFLRMRRHLRTIPSELIAPMESEDADTAQRRMFQALASDWSHRWVDSLDPAEVAVRSLRNRALRMRLLGVLQILERWWALLADPHIDGAAPLYISNLINHALECLGASQRGEDIPAAIADYDLARHSQQHARNRIREEAGGQGRPGSGSRQ
jgi:hypothetical protein